MESIADGGGGRGLEDKYEEVDALKADEADRIPVASHEADAETSQRSVICATHANVLLINSSFLLELEGHILCFVEESSDFTELLCTAAPRAAVIPTRMRKTRRRKQNLRSSPTILYLKI